MRTKTIILCLAAALALASAAVAGAGLFGRGSDSGVRFERTAVTARALTFRDGPSGSIEVYDDGAVKPFVTLDREQNRFPATALRLLAGERLRRTGTNAGKPFMLTLWTDHRLSLEDPVTGETIELAAFGSTNEQSFAKLIALKKVSQ